MQYQRRGIKHSQQCTGETCRGGCHTNKIKCNRKVLRRQKHPPQDDSTGGRT